MEAGGGEWDGERKGEEGKGARAGQQERERRCQAAPSTVSQAHQVTVGQSPEEMPTTGAENSAQSPQMSKSSYTLSLSPAPKENHFCRKQVQESEKKMD